LGGHLQVVTYLLNKGADPNIPQDKTLETPLFVASQKGHLEIIQVLLHHGANPHLKNESNQLPINVAHDEKVRGLLLEKSQNSTNVEQGSTFSL